MMWEVDDKDVSMCIDIESGADEGNSAAPHVRHRGDRRCDCWGGVQLRPGVQPPGAAQPSPEARRSRGIPIVTDDFPSESGPNAVTRA